MSSFVNFGSDSPFNLKVGLGKSYKFIFDDQTAFDNFNFLNYGSHIVEKSYPNITLTITPFGPLNFSYITEHKMGSIDVSEDCQSCNNFQYEVFISNDDINQDNVEKYIKDCGSSEYSTSNIEILILKDYGNGYKNYLISYCCDLSLDVSSDYCTVRWDLNATVDCSTSQYTVPAEGISVSAPNMTCQAPGSIFNSWHCSSDLNKIVYYTKADFCHKGCSSSDVPGALLIPPQAPTQSELEELLILPPTPTATSSIFSPATNGNLSFSNAEDVIKNSIALDPNYTETDPSNVIIGNLTDNEFAYYPKYEKEISRGLQDLAGDKPHHRDYCHFLGHSKVLNKVNQSDLSDRVFYRETIDGYFYKFSSYLRKGEGNNSLNINGEDLFFTAENESETHTLPKNMKESGPEDFYNHKKQSLSFVSLIDYTSPPDVTTAPTPKLVEDESLFHKIYYFSNDSLSIDSVALSLNWSYWLFELPKKVYGKNIWWENLNQDHLPSFEIVTDQNNYLYNGYEFLNGSKKVYFSHVNNNPDIESISFIKNKLGDTNNFTEDASYLDPVFNIKHIIFSELRNIKIKYHFSPKSDLISTEYQQFNLPIEKLEELYFFPENSFFKKRYDNFAFDYAVDKTLGVINPKHKLIQGMSTRMFDS